MKDIVGTTEAGYSMDEIFEISKAKRLTDKENYLLSWLTASPEKMRCGGVDSDSRFETVLSLLHKERKTNVIPFKKLRFRK